MKFLKFLKKFILGTILFVIKEIFSFFIKAFLFLVVIFSIGAFFAKTALEKDKVTIEKGSYVEIDLSKEYKEKGKNLPEFLKGQDTNFFSMLRAFDSIERDGNIKGVVLKLDNLSLDSAQIEEVGKKIDNLKKALNGNFKDKKNNKKNEVKKKFVKPVYEDFTGDFIDKILNGTLGGN